MTAFEEFGVLPELGKAIDELDWTLPTDIQAESIPLVLGGGDVLMAAETGSGKTAAFCLPIIQIVWETLKDIESGKTAKTSQSISPAWTMSTVDRGTALAVSPDGMRVQSREQKEWHGTRCTRGVTSGKWGFEATVTDEGLCRVGWSTTEATLDLGTDKLGFGFGGTGKKSNNKQFDDYGEAFGKSDVITCLIDLEKSEIKFLKNNVDYGTAFHIAKQLVGSTFFPAVVLKNAEMSFNFGDMPLKHPLPAGYKPIKSAPKEKVIVNMNGVSGSSGVIKPAKNAPQAIIIEPSRELAEQTYTQIHNFKKYIVGPKLRDLLVIGGVNVKDQLAALQNEGVDIIVGTPGRLEDLIQGGYLSLSHCRFFVLDEADALLKQGYTDLIERLHRQMPKITADGRRLQMIVCSATLHAFEVKKMADKLMHFPTWVDLKGEDAVPETVHHVVVNVDPQNDKSWHSLKKHIMTDGVHAKDNVRPGGTGAETLSEAVKMLKGEYCIRAIDEHKMDRAIIFCRTKIDCDNLEKYFNQIDRQKYSCVCLHGDRKPHERKANLESFKQKQVKFLVCTDVAARGLDITGLPFMINVTLPDEKSNYVHRIGRVGRAERMGLAISLVSKVPEKVWYHGDFCKTRGRNCWNTNLISDRGCCIWYNEPQFLADIEEHLNVTIQQIDSTIKVPHNEFDGKVVYGEKRNNFGSGYENHTAQMAPAVKDLCKLESDAQKIYLKRHLNKEAPENIDITPQEICRESSVINKTVVNEEPLKDSEVDDVQSKQESTAEVLSSHAEKDKTPEGDDRTWGDMASPAETCVAEMTWDDEHDNGKDSAKDDGEENAEKDDGEENAEKDEVEKNVEKDDGGENAKTDDCEENAEMEDGEENAEMEDGEENAEMDDGEENAKNDDGEENAKKDDGEENAKKNDGEENAKKDDGKVAPRKRWDGPPAAPGKSKAEKKAKRLARNANRPERSGWHSRKNRQLRLQARKRAGISFKLSGAQRRKLAKLRQGIIPKPKPGQQSVYKWYKPLEGTPEEDERDIKRQKLEPHSKLTSSGPDNSRPIGKVRNQEFSRRLNSEQSYPAREFTRTVTYDKEYLNGGTYGQPAPKDPTSSTYLRRTIQRQNAKEKRRLIRESADTPPNDRERTIRNDVLMCKIIDSNGAELTDFEVDYIRTKIRLAMDATVFRGEAEPKFVCSELVNGNFRITCANRYTLEWLQTTVGDWARYEGASLLLVEKVSDLQERKLLVYIPGVPINDLTFFKTLEIQNPSLKTDRWVVTHFQRDRRDIGQTMYLRINGESIRALDALDWRPYYGLNRLLFEETTKSKPTNAQDDERSSHY